MSRALTFRAANDFSIGDLSHVLDLQYESAVVESYAWVDSSAEMAEFVDSDVLPVRHPIDEDDGTDDNPRELEILINQGKRLFVVLECLRKVIYQHQMLYLGADFKLKPTARDTRETFSGFLCLTHQPESLTLEMAGHHMVLRWDALLYMDHEGDYVAPMNPDRVNDDLGLHQLLIDPAHPHEHFIPVTRLSSHVFDVRSIKRVERAAAGGVVQRVSVTTDFRALFVMITEMMLSFGVTNPLGMLFGGSPNPMVMTYTLPRLFNILQRYNALLRHESSSAAQSLHNILRRKVMILTFVALLELQRYFGAWSVVYEQLQRAYMHATKALLCIGTKGWHVHNMLRNYTLLKTRIMSSLIVAEFRKKWGDSRESHNDGGEVVSAGFARAFWDRDRYWLQKTFLLTLPGMDVHMITCMVLYAEDHGGVGVYRTVRPLYEFMVQVCRLEHPELAFGGVPGRDFTMAEAHTLHQARLAIVRPVDFETTCTVQNDLIFEGHGRLMNVFREFNVRIAQPPDDDDEDNVSTESDFDRSDEDEE